MSYAVEYCFFFNRKVSQSKPQSYAKIYFKTLRNFAENEALCGKIRKANFNCVSPKNINIIFLKKCRASKQFFPMLSVHF